MNAVAEVLPLDEMDEMTEAHADVIPLTQFITEFGNDLLNAVSRQNPPIYDGVPSLERDAIMAGLLRSPFPAQRDVVQAVTRLLVDDGAQSAVINAEMGTGKVRRIGA